MEPQTEVSRPEMVVEGPVGEVEERNSIVSIVVPSPITNRKLEKKSRPKKKRKLDPDPTKRKFRDNFKQQSFNAWQPVYTARTVAPTLFLFGLLFIPIGIWLWVIADQVHEIHIDYTHCTDMSPQNELNESCAKIINSSEVALEKECHCRIAFEVKPRLEGDVYIYYALTNFYQNHRRYVTSRDYNQLLGKVGDAEHPLKPSRECAPLDCPGEDDGNGEKDNSCKDFTQNKRLYFPCGAIANSMFSDEIAISYQPAPSNKSGEEPPSIRVPLKRTGIAWKSDKKHKFKNPPWFQNFSGSPDLQRVFVKPKYWRKNLWELDLEDKDNNGLMNEDLIVWMRVAALPDFRKLHRILNRSDSEMFEEGLPEGNYTLEVNYAFPVVAFHGTKRIIITTGSSLGLPNGFLGLTYFIVGIVCLILGVFLLAVHLTARRKSHKVLQKKTARDPLINYNKLKTTYGTEEEKRVKTA